MRVARSATGPGNPYWKRPAGSTGGNIDVPAIGRAPGTGAGREVVDVADIEVEVCMAWISFLDLVEIIAAVMPAPVAALTAAMIANVVFDIVNVTLGEEGIYCVEGKERI